MWGPVPKLPDIRLIRRWPAIAAKRLVRGWDWNTGLIPMNLIHNSIAEVSHKQSVVLQISFIERSLQLTYFAKWRVNIDDDENREFIAALCHNGSEVC